MRTILEQGLFEALQEIPHCHARGTHVYELLDAQCTAYFSNSPFRDETAVRVPFGPFGDLVMPYQRMGQIDSLDLFGLDELIIFSFYNANRGRYRKTLDIGANLGLHSVLMAKSGFNVLSYEPDDRHFEWFERRLILNEVEERVSPVRAAVSDRSGRVEFVRVEGNTTGSHLSGAKDDPYGALTRYPVDVHDVAPLAAQVDFMKIDAEGHEVVILAAIPEEVWAKTDAIVEVGTPENATKIFNLFARRDVRMFAQKLGWGPVTQAEEIPKSYKEGSLFISAKSSMPWN